MNDNFFNRSFWRQLTIQSLVIVIGLLAVNFMLGAKIEQLIQLSESLNTTMTTFTNTVETAMGIDPEELQQKADALRESATTVGEGVGDGGGEIVDRVGNAFRKFQENRNEVTE